MKRSLLLLAPLLLVACTPAAPIQNPPAGSSSSSVAMDADIVVDGPAADAVVTSPLTVTGRARGTWYFEASFPVKLLDDAGNELVIAPAQAQGDWMTEDFVPFTVTFPFVTTAKIGTLVLSKDNPSGMSENDKSVSIPVKFP